jgi:KDO2-lipid IV(A) lauroyltransferase
MRKRLEYFLFLCVRRFVLSLPLRSVQLVGASIGLTAYYLVSSRRRVALENLANAFPEKMLAERVRIAKGAFRNYGISLFEMLWFPRISDDVLREMVTVKDIDKLKNGYARHRGMVILSGHFGNWELIAFAVARLSGLLFTIIVQTQSNGLVDAVINKHRCLLGNRVVPMGMSVREILITLRKGGIVAIAPDQSGPVEGVYVNFFGRVVATHQGPAVFSLKTGAEMLFGFLVRQPDGRYEVHIEDISTEGLPGNTEEAVVELTRRHTALLEQYIRKYPDHWLWMHRRWKHTLESVLQEKRQKGESAT